MAVAQRMTADEYLQLGERWPRTQLVEGEVVVNEPRWRHQRVLADLSFALEAWVRAALGRGRLSPPVDVELDERNVFAPDAHWYRDGRAPSDADDPPYPLADLVVEVRSPSTWRHDIGAKKSAYERAGLPELWLVDTAAEVILVFRRSSARAATFDVSLEQSVADELTSPLLPGFALALRELFDA
ncbi:MAG: Uma2 family endonuclease [Solirubrobacteraceae bacterium]|nr:Uma2 family endonuclease [Solirubrobacteraceae bacterium]